MLTNDDCLLCAYRPLLGLFVIFYPYTYQCNHEQQSILIKPSAYFTILSLVVITVQLIALISVIFSAVTEKNANDLFLETYYISSGLSWFLVSISLLTSRRKFRKWLQNMLSASAFCLRVSELSQGNTIIRLRKILIFSTISVVVYVPAVITLHFLCSEDIGKTLIMAMMCYFCLICSLFLTSHVLLLTLVLQSVYNDAKEKLSNRENSHHRLNNYIQEIAQLRGSLYYYQEMFNAYIKRPFLTILWYAIMVVIGVLCLIIEYNLHATISASYFYLLQVHSNVLFIMTGIIVTLLRKQTDMDSQFLSFLHTFPLCKLTTSEINKVEQLIFDMDAQPITLKYTANSPVSAKLVVNIFQYGFTYFIVLVQMYYFR